LTSPNAIAPFQMALMDQVNITVAGR